MARADPVLIGELARRAKVTSGALRLYERAALIAPLSRGNNNYRYYDAGIVEWVLVITMMLSLGLSLHDIRAALAEHEPIRTRGSDADARQRMKNAIAAYRTHVARLDEQVTEIALRRQKALARIAYCEAQLAGSGAVAVAHENHLQRVRRPGRIEYRAP
jgi:DNA-binding transcriptional MerR regulator